MHHRRWYRNGPKVLGYEPGWLWWALVAVVLVVGVLVLRTELAERHRSAAYIDERIQHHADQQGIDADLVRAVVQAESGGDWRAQSNKDARGLMQITPVALEDVRQRADVGDGDLFDVDYNLRVGTTYLSYLLDRFEGNPTLAVAAYHMGPTRVSRGLRKYPELAPREMVRRHGGPQTRAYVQKVLETYQQVD